MSSLAATTQARLILLIGSVLVPLAIFAGLLLWRFSDNERARYRDTAQRLAQQVSASVDRELTGLGAALETLATSPELQDGGSLASFDAQARALLRTRGSYVGMRDRTGQQIINTGLAFGAPLPRSTDPNMLAADRQVFETGRTVVSDLYVGTTTRLKLVLIDAPVFRDGIVVEALSISLDPARLAKILTEAAQAEWTIAIVDRQNRIVARSRQHEQFLGSEATPDLQRATSGAGGTWNGTTLEGTPVLSAYTRSPLSGWRVAVGVPADVIEAPMRRLTVLLSGAALLVFVLAVVLASQVARAITEPLGRLRAAAAQLGQGVPVPALATRLREVDEVGRALSQARTEIEARQADLAASEERFRAAVRAVEGVIWTSDADGRMAGEQTGWSALTGQSRAEYEGYGWAGAVHPDEAEPTLEAWNQAVREGRIFVFEHRVRRRDGAYRRFSVRSVPVLDPDGAVREWVGVHTDITDEYEAKASLAESRARLRTIIDTVPVGVLIAEAPSGRILEGNAQIARILRHDVLHSADVEEYAGWKAFHADGTLVLPTEYPLARAVQAGEERPELEALYCRGDGTTAWIRVVGAPIRDASGAVTGGVVAVLDIDRERRAQAELQELNASLERRVEEAIAERDRIWRISTELMLVARLDGEIVAVNPAWLTTLGWSDRDLIGTSFMDLIHPDDAQRSLAEAGRLAQGATTPPFENRCRHKDGSYRWLSWTAVPEAGFIHAIARDVTAEKQAGEALRQAEEQLRQSQKMDVLGQLTGGVAHDFNNLLTVVTGHLDLAQRRLEAGAGDPRLLRNIGQAQQGAQRAATLTQRLLAFSRRSPLLPELLDLNAVAQGMSDLIARTLGETITVRTELAENLWPVEADLNQVESAILNLCVNARDAMPDGGELTIETGNVVLDKGMPAVSSGEIEPGDYVAIVVRDTGMGMTPEVRERVFEPFFTTKPVGKGTGLGLSQVFGFLRQSGGVAAIASEPGQGTMATLHFPRSTRAMQRPEAGGSTHSGVVGGSGETLLVVEDEDMVRDFTVSALEEAGFRVIAAGDGPSGLALLDAHPEIALVFTDVVLVGPLNGREMADEARRRRPDIPIVFTTGYARDAILRPDQSGDEVELITKPFTAGALVRKIRTTLGREERLAGA